MGAGGLVKRSSEKRFVNCIRHKLPFQTTSPILRLSGGKAD